MPGQQEDALVSEQEIGEERDKLYGGKRVGDYPR
jgi:hypothetical protein